MTAPCRYRSYMAQGRRVGFVRRLVICLGLGAFAPLGTVSTGSLAGAAIVGVVLAAVCWMVWGMLDADEHRGSSSDD